MRRIFIIAGVTTYFALAAVAPSASSEPPPSGVAGMIPAPSPETLTIARAIAEQDLKRESMNQAAAIQEEWISSGFALASTRPQSVTVEQARPVVDKVFDELQQVLVDDRARALASTYTGAQLREVSAFLTSPTGIAYRAKNALFMKAVGEMMGMPSSGVPESAATPRADAFSAASPTTRSAVLRIIKAENTRVVASKVLPTLRRILESATKAAPPVGKNLPTKADLAGDQRFADQYVEIRERFLAANFSENQLEEFAAYLESVGARAMSEGRANMQHILAPQIAAAYTNAYQEIERRLCTSFACSPEQRAVLEERTRMITAALPGVFKAEFAPADPHTPVRN